MFKVRIYTSHRGTYRAIVRLNDDTTFDMVTLETTPIKLQSSLPFKERQYLSYLEEGTLGTAARKAIDIGKYKGIDDDALEFCELAYKQEASQ